MAGSTTSSSSTGGVVSVVSGAGASSSSGAVTIRSANALSSGGSGAIVLSSGTTFSGSSGSLTLATGVARAATSGAIVLSSGESSVAVGERNSGVGGDVYVYAGSTTSSSSTGGLVHGRARSRPLALVEVCPPATHGRCRARGRRRTDAPSTAPAHRRTRTQSATCGPLNAAPTLS
jgi:hypothetical protein